MAIFGFPDPVNEKAARVVAAGVVAMALTAVLADQRWLLVPLTYGFLARVLTGPTLSPLGRLATQVVALRLGPPRLVPGPPKRFAQGIGLAVTAAASVAELAGVGGLSTGLLLVLVVAAGLEAAVGLCLGCQVFRGLMRVGLVPAATCEACAQLWNRPAAPSRAG